MILADKIIHHRKQLNLTQEQLAEKLNVSRQSISKWEGAQSIPDTDKLLALSNIFGVSLDYLLRDDIKDVQYSDTDYLSKQQVSLEMANEFIKLKMLSAKRIALGVFLCISSPILLITLVLLKENDFIQLEEDILNGVGAICLFIIVALAVGLFIKDNFTLKPFEFIETESFESEYGVESLAKKKASQYHNTHTNRTIVGVMLLISSVIPLFISELLIKDHLFNSLKMTIFLLMLASGVYLLVNSSIKHNTYQQLLQEGEYSVSKKANNKIIGTVAGVYWLVVVAIYLAYSFITFNWDQSWIIFPVAGVLFGAISIIVNIFANKQHN